MPKFGKRRKISNVETFYKNKLKVFGNAPKLVLSALEDMVGAQEDT